MSTSPADTATLATLLGARGGRFDTAYSPGINGQAFWALLESDDRFSVAQDSQHGSSVRHELVLQHLLACLDRVNRLRDDLLRQPNTSDACRAQQETLATAESCVGFASARLIEQWTGQAHQDDDGSSYPSATPYYAVVINDLVQHCAVGHRHPLHGHVLVASCGHRVFESPKNNSNSNSNNASSSSSSDTATIVQWPCARCGCMLQLAIDSLDARRKAHPSSSVATPVIYRCAPCRFHLCSSCFDSAIDATPPASSALGPAVAFAAREDAPPSSTPALCVDRFFLLTLPFLELQSAQYGRIVRQLATEIRRRVLEIVRHRVSEIAALTRLFRELMECPSVPLQIVQPAAKGAEAQDSSVVAWLPASVVTWKMAMQSFLGPFFRATTISNELSLRTTEQLDDVRANWEEGYDQELKTHLIAIMQKMLADSQPPLVADAAMCWLATVVTSANRRRLTPNDTDDGLDGFLINVSQVLASLAQTALGRADDSSASPSAINPEYHQGFVSIRGFGDKDNPETPLRERSADEKRALMDAEDAKLRAMDRQSIRDFRKQRGCSGEEDVNQERLATHYYPDMASHFGVRCDRCQAPNFSGPRYKCACCEDADLCEACFQVFSAESAGDSRRPGECADAQTLANWKTRLVDGVEAGMVTHNLDHVHFRVSIPVPMCNAMHFEWKDFDPASVMYGADDSPDEADRCAIQCAECASPLDDVDILYRCSNCVDARFVCASCLEVEEKQHNPHALHAPGHIYLAITRGWRRLYSPRTRALRFRSLSFLPSLVPRVYSDKASDLFHLAIKCLHLGPLGTLRHYLRLLKEEQELEAFCLCEEETFQYEKALVDGVRQDHRPAHRNGAIPRPTGAHRRRSAKMSSYYNSSKVRLREMMAGRHATETQLLSPGNVARWLLFYATTARWVLGIASVSEDAFRESLTAPSPAFCAFPEHYLADLCDLVYLLGLRRVDCSKLAVTWAQMLDVQPGDDGARHVARVIEPIFVLLAQVVLSSACTNKAALRIEALKALPSLLSFFSEKATYRSALDGILQRNTLLASTLFPGLVRFHHDMNVCSADGHHHIQTPPLESDNGAMSSASTEDRGTEAAMQFGGDTIVSVRASVATVLQYLWQIPTQRVTMSRVLSPSPSLSGDWTTCCRQELRVLVEGMWSDMTRLVEEANDKITALRHLRELLDSSVRGRGVSLPIRPHMMDGYVALHSKQLRLTFRTLLEVLGTALWMADASPLRTVLLSQSEAEECVRALCFALSNAVQAVESHTWEISVHVLADGKRVLAHLVHLVLLCANGQDAGDQTNAEDRVARRELLRTCGSAMVKRLGDLNTRIRWNVLSAALERKQHVSSDPTALADSWSRARILAHFARDGRFDSDRFVYCLDALRQRGEDAELYEHLCARDVRAFASTMVSARHMRQLGESVEALVVDAPEEFQDPLLGSLMTNPVRLPSSGKVVDRAVIARHLRSFRGAIGCDPFTRAPLTLSMVVPCPSLARAIRTFVAAKLSALDAATATSALLVLGFENAVEREDSAPHQPRGVKRSHDAMASRAGS